MITRAMLTLKLVDYGSLKSLRSVLAPDSRGLPRGLRFSAVQTGTEVEFLIESASATTSLSTVLALLRDIALFQEVWLLSRERDARVRRT